MMSPRRIFLAAFALAAIATPAQASTVDVAGALGKVTAQDTSLLVPAATQYPVGGAGFATALRIAADHWGPACGGGVDLSWGTLAPQTNAASSWANPVGAYADPQSNSDCRIVFNPNQLWSWVKFCTVVEHEWGHLAGHPHSANPLDLMAPIYELPTSECARTPDPTQAAAPALPLVAAVPATLKTLAKAAAKKVAAAPQSILRTVKKATKAAKPVKARKAKQPKKAKKAKKPARSRRR